MATILQLKDLFTLWLAVGNGVMALWALALYFRRRMPGRLFFQATVFLQVLMAAQVLLGVTLMGGGLWPHASHIFYGVLNGVLALVRVFGYTRILGSGQSGILWHAFWPCWPWAWWPGRW